MTGKIKIFIVVLLFVAIAGAGGYFAYRHFGQAKVYSGYEVVTSSDRADSKAAEYRKFRNGFLRYSRDGIAYYSADNVPQWNASYEFSEPILDVRDNYCAVAGIGSSHIYVFNEAGAVSTVDTVMSIVSISVSDKGYVAAILEDGNDQYIDMFDIFGEKVYHIKTSIQGNGVPTDISISDDGIKLMVAYTTIEDGELDTSVAFYNFGQVGKNEAERLVGGFEQYHGMLVPKVEFVNENTAVAFGTGIVSIYSISQYPKLLVDIVLEQELHGLIYSNDYIGLIFANHQTGHPYVIDVYDTKGSKIYTYEIDKAYRSYEFVGNNIFMYDDYDMKLVGFNGEERYSGTLDIPIDSMIPVAVDTYVYINSRKVLKLKLK